MNRRAVIAVTAWGAAVAVTGTLVFAGCGSSARPAAAPLPATAGHGGHASSPTGSEHTPGMVMPDGSTMTAPAAPAAPAEDATGGAGASATSTMVCEGSVKASVKDLVALTTEPTTTSTFKDSLFTCTYDLPEGKLVLTVKESGTPTAAKAYFDGLQAGATAPVTLDGIEGLGLPSFRSPVGIAAFVRDDKTLLVDARGLPPTVGPQKTERTSFAYAVATDVLVCWREHDKG